MTTGWPRHPSGVGPVKPFLGVLISHEGQPPAPRGSNGPIFVEAMLAIYNWDHQKQTAVRVIETGSARFRAEGLLDGELDMEPLRLTAHRRVGNIQEWLEQRRRLGNLLDTKADRGKRHHAKGHSFTREALLLSPGSLRWAGAPGDWERAFGPPGAG